MRVTFVRTAGARDRIYVARDDGSEASWEFPSYGDAPPHDLVHLIAEAELGLDDALWGRIAAGADLAAVNAAAARATQGGLAIKYAGLGDLRDVLLSEAIAAAVGSARTLASTPADRRALLDDAVAQLGATIPPAIDAAALARVCARLDEVAARWRALRDDPRGKGALVLAWPGGALEDPATAPAVAASAPAATAAPPAPRPRRRSRS